MLINPILPIGVMSVICILLLFLKRKGGWAYARQILMILLLFIINLRPMLPGDGSIEMSEEKLDTYVLFVIDDTISMIAEDYDGNKERLEGVRQDCAYLIDELSGAHFSVMSFHNVANQLCPYTDNGDHVKNVIDAIYPIESYYANGTSLNVAKDGMLASLKQAAKSTDGKLAVFFISDGEITSENDTLQSFSEVAPFIENGAVLGYGTKEGGEMKPRSYYDGSAEVLMDYDQYPAVPAVSKYDDMNLKKIAKDFSVDYFHRKNADKKDLDGVIQKIKADANVVRENKLVTKTTDPMLGAKDLYYIPAFILFILLLVEAWLMITKRTNGG